MIKHESCLFMYPCLFEMFQGTQYPEHVVSHDMCWVLGALVNLKQARVCNK